jgi:hypothetical protein
MPLDDVIEACHHKAVVSSCFPRQLSDHALAAFVPGLDGQWLAELLFLGPSPVLTLAAATVVAFPRLILRRPLIWAVAGSGTVLVISTVAIWAMTGDLWGLLGLPFAVVTPLVFWGLVKALRIDGPAVSTR